MARKELDRWARALDVDNDDGAITRLKDLHERVVAVEGIALRYGARMRGCPEPDLLAAVARGLIALEELAQELVRVRGKFVQHQRGGQ